MIFLQMDNKFILKFPTTDKYGTRDSRLTSLQCFYIYNLALILAGKKEKKMKKTSFEKIEMRDRTRNRTNQRNSFLYAFRSSSKRLSLKKILPNNLINRNVAIFL